MAIGRWQCRRFHTLLCSPIVLPEFGLAELGVPVAKALHQLGTTGAGAITAPPAPPPIACRDAAIRTKDAQLADVRRQLAEQRQQVYKLQKEVEDERRKVGEAPLIARLNQPPPLLCLAWCRQEAGALSHRLEPQAPPLVLSCSSLSSGYGSPTLPNPADNALRGLPCSAACRPPTTLALLCTVSGSAMTLGTGGCRGLAVLVWLVCCQARDGFRSHTASWGA